MEQKERMSLEGIFEKFLFFKERKIKAAEMVTKYWKERGDGQSQGLFFSPVRLVSPYSKWK